MKAITIQVLLPKEEMWIAKLNITAYRKYYRFRAILIFNELPIEIKLIRY